MKKHSNIHIIGVGTCLQCELERLYDSEINVKLSTFWDGGWDVYLGDEMNGYKAHGVFGEGTGDMRGIVEWLREKARLHYPNSSYVKKLK